MKKCHFQVPIKLLSHISYINKNAIYVTDSVPFCETSFENPIGLVLMVDLDSQEIKPTALAYRCLAHPSCLVKSHDEKNLFVSETCENRIIRFVLTSSGIYAFRYEIRNIIKCLSLIFWQIWNPQHLQFHNWIRFQQQLESIYIFFKSLRLTFRKYFDFRKSRDNWNVVFNNQTNIFIFD